MLPGVELARRRRVHYHGDVAAEHHHHGHSHSHSHSHHQGAQAGTGVVGPALAARNRLEEKLRRAAAPSSAPSRWGRRSREQVTSRQQQNDPQELLLPTESTSPSTATMARTRRRADQTRTVPKPELCAVCLDEVRKRHQRVTRLPCSHEYHSECVLPWLAIQPDCPCCRTVVPSVEALG